MKCGGRVRKEHTNDETRGTMQPSWVVVHLANFAKSRRYGFVGPILTLI